MSAERSGESAALPQPTTYTFMPEACLRGKPMDTAAIYPLRPITVEWRGGDTWAVTRGGSVYNRDAGEWEYEPSPSNRDADFLARTRYSREEALSVGAFVAEHSGRTQAVDQ